MRACVSFFLSFSFFCCGEPKSLCTAHPLTAAEGSHREKVYIYMYTCVLMLLYVCGNVVYQSKVCFKMQRKKGRSI